MRPSDIITEKQKEDGECFSRVGQRFYQVVGGGATAVSPSPLFTVYTSINDRVKGFGNNSRTYSGREAVHKVGTDW
jgi:hypothetical protein